MRMIRKEYATPSAQNRPVRRDISLVLLFKAAALAALWWLFFSDAHRPNADAAAMNRHLALAQPAAPSASRPERDNGSKAHD